MSEYEWPPSNQEEADEWSYEHPLDAIAYAAGWTHSGMGYGPEQAREEWPEMEGFDFDSGLPDWGSGIREEPGFEYRTMLMAGDPYTSVAKVTPDGWEVVASFGINPEPELYDEEGSPSGHLYIGEGNREVVYRRPEDWEEEEEEDEDEGRFEPNAAEFRRISDEQAHRLMHHYRDVSTEGYVQVVPRSLVEAFGSPGPGDGYKSGIEWCFESDDERVVCLGDDKGTSLYRTGLPTPGKLAGSSRPEQLRVSTHDEQSFEDFVEWLESRADVRGSVSIEQWLEDD